MTKPIDKIEICDFFSFGNAYNIPYVKQQFGLINLQFQIVRLACFYMELMRYLNRLLVGSVSCDVRHKGRCDFHSLGGELQLISGFSDSDDFCIPTLPRCFAHCQYRSMKP